MKQISFDPTRFQKPTTKANSERASLIEPFVQRLNQSRVLAGYKPLKPSFYASKMSHIPTDELHFHYKQCSQAKNFCSFWWYMNCPKK